jgi:hypothetical protein
LDPQSNHRDKLPANHVRVLDQHKTLALFSFNSTKQTYQIGYFDVQTNQIVSTVSLNLPPSIQKQYHSGMSGFAISPSKSKAAIGDSTGRILIFDLKTGDIIGETNNHLTASSWITNIFFLNENEILFDGDPQIFKFYLTSKLRTSMAQNEDGAGFGLALSEDHQFVYWARYEKIVTVDAQTLEVISQDPIYNLRKTGVSGVQTESLKEIPEDGNHFFARSNLDYGIFNSSLEKVFDFNKRYFSINIRDVLFSHDKETVYILHKNTPASKTTLIDQWKLDTSNIDSAL